jgi:hypothetical protein
MNEKIQFRAWDEKQKYMAYQGDPDLETLQSFIHHYGDKELMQWTGLWDKNGKKIYEGDIVGGELPDGTRGASNVFWGYNEYQPFSYLNCRSEQLEVIGNIYENPELLNNG